MTQSPKRERARGLGTRIGRLIPAGGGQELWSRLRLGRSREGAILLPAALVVLVVLSTFTLLSYRRAVELLVAERCEEAARQVRQLASRLDTSRLPTAAELQGLAPWALGIALLDEQGVALVEAGLLPAGNLLAPVGFRGPEEAIGVGPDAVAGDSVVGLAPLGPAGNRLYLRVDVIAEVLASQSRTLPFLTGLVLTINVGVVLLVLLFLRHLLLPYESLMERARQVARVDFGTRSQAPQKREMEDEVAFLLATFDRALGALTQPPRDPEKEDIAALDALERTLSPSLESGLLLLDGDGLLLALNPIGKDFLGIPEVVPGTPLETVLAPHPRLLELLLNCVAQRRTVQRQECVVEVGDKSLTLGLTVHPLRPKQDTVQGYLVLFADLTEIQKQAQERHLADSLARIGELSAGVAHEMRNSLASLRGYLTLLERQKPDEDTLADSLGEIRHEADHLQRVLEDFLSFARPGTARLEEVDLEKIIERAAADPALSAARIDLVKSHFASPSDRVQLPLIRGDSQLLERALRNLVHNAFQAQQEIGVDQAIQVRFELEPEELRLIVEDRGAGIPPAMRDKLFIPFATGRSGGVGLGLALTHRIVDLHGGRIRLEDRSGGGTRATLSFPAEKFVTPN